VVSGLLADKPKLGAMAAAAKARGRPNAAAEIAGHIGRVLDTPRP